MESQRINILSESHELEDKFDENWYNTEYKFKEITIS